MIKTICFDLGDDRELYLTIDEIIKLQSAFRFVCLDQYAEPGKPIRPLSISNPFPKIDIEEQLRKAKVEQEKQQAFRNHFNQSMGDSCIGKI